MDSGKARELYDAVAPAVAFVEVESPDGSVGIGSCFHVGEGVFVTARHVVDGMTITDVGMTESFYVELHGEEAAMSRTTVDGKKVRKVANPSLKICRGPFALQDKRIDVAVFQVESIDPATPAPELGGHLDDWTDGSEFILWEALVLGYPPIPMASNIRLVAARAEINTAVDRYDTPYAHFILSTMSRGGFSGGIVFSEGGWVLGVVTSSLGSDLKEPEQLGFMAAVAVEPIYLCLAAHRMLPKAQAEMWDGLFDDIANDSQYVNPEPIAAIRHRPDAPTAFQSPPSPDPWE
jgi:S1-C subfamily serine protease